MLYNIMVYYSLVLRKDLSTGYGLRFSTGANRRKRFSANTYRNIGLFLTEVSGNLREFPGECNPGILYSNSLLEPHGKIHSMSLYVVGCKCYVHGNRNWLS